MHVDLLGLPVETLKAMAPRINSLRSIAGQSIVATALSLVLLASSVFASSVVLASGDEEGGLEPNPARSVRSAIKVSPNNYIIAVVEPFGDMQSAPRPNESYPICSVWVRVVEPLASEPKPGPAKFKLYLPGCQRIWRQEVIVAIPYAHDDGSKDPDLYGIRYNEIATPTEVARCKEAIAAVLR